MRILVTGSREWVDDSVILEAILDVCDGVKRTDVTIVHGHCPTGADELAESIAMQYCFGFERHPADWEQHGKAAGPKRNQEMVDLGADVCLAFLRPNSRGTVDCAARARAAGIPVKEFYDYE